MTCEYLQDLFDDHLETIEEVPVKPLQDSLWAHVQTSSFCAEINEYLRYLLIFNGLKTLPQKIQAS